MAKINEPTAEQYAAFGKYAAALLGSSLDWNGGDICEALAGAAPDKLGVKVGDQDDDLLAFWRERADEAGVEYEEDDWAPWMGL